MKRVLISGWYGCGNIGDDAILITIIERMRAKYKNDIKFYILSSNPDQVLAYFDDRSGIQPIKHYSFIKKYDLFLLFFRGKIYTLIKVFMRVDLFMLGGGGLIQDANKVKNLIKYLDECLIAKIFSVPTMYFGIGVGPLVTKTGKRVTRFISGLVNVITVRDKAGEDILKEIGVRNPNLYTTADPAFVMSTLTNGGTFIRSIIEKMPKDKICIGICPRERVSWSNLNDNNWLSMLKELAELCDYFIKRMGAVVVFIPFMDDDMVLINEIVGYIKGRDNVISIDNRLSPKEAKLLIRRMRYVVGMRLHSLIFAAAESVPAIGINYAPKIKALYEEIDNLGIVSDEISFKSDDCIRFVERYEIEYDNNVKELQKTINVKKNLALKNFEYAFNFLENRRTN